MFFMKEKTNKKIPVLLMETYMAIQKKCKEAN